MSFNNHVTSHKSRKFIESCAFSLSINTFQNDQYDLSCLLGCLLKSIMCFNSLNVINDGSAKSDRIKFGSKIFLRAFKNCA